jgi:CheY-like chemotaxis protein
MDKKARILIAEDSAEDRELLLRVLRPLADKRGLIVDCVDNGEKALRELEERSYALVFLDENMPECTGLEILKYIKKNQRSEKAIILTGYPDVNEKFCTLLGADEYVEKPITPKALAAILEKYIPSV